MIERKKDTILPPFGLAEDVLGVGAGDNKSDGPAAGWNSHSNISRSGPADRDKGLAKFVTFFLGAEEYGLPITQVQEINRIAEITRVPNAPDHVKGVINLRGRILPVIELRKRLNLGSADLTKEGRIVVVEFGPKVLGFMVDRVSQVLNLDPAQIEAAPEEVVQVEQNFIKGVGKVADRMIILLDLEKIISKT